MRRLNIAFAIVTFILMHVSAAVAQEHKRVEVTTIYTPEVASATKIVAPATIADKPDIEPDINYGISPDTWQIELDDHDFKPATAGYWDFGRAKRFNAKLGGGYPLASDGALRCAMGNKRVGYFGVGVEHDGNFSSRINALGVERTMAESYNMRNRAYVHGGVIAGRQLFEVDADYDFDIYNRYAELMENPARTMFHDAMLKLSYGDSFVDLSRLNFGVEAHGGYWSCVSPAATLMHNPMTEFSAGGSVRVAREVRENVIGIRAMYDMWHSVVSSYQDMRAGLSVEYARKFDVVDIDMSIGYMYDKVHDRAKASHYVMPRVKLLFDFDVQAFVPYVELNTSVSQNSMAALYRQNPYLDGDASYEALLTMPNTRSYDLNLGFNGSAIASRLGYRLYFGANFMRDQLVWYINNVGTFGVDTGNNTRFFAGAEISCRPVGGLYIAASVYAHANNSNAKYYVDDANWHSKLEVEYRIKGWKFYVLGDVVGKRRWSSEVCIDGVCADVFITPTTVDLRAGISVRASQRVEIYADGYNLLNSRIYDYAYYYRNGAGFMAGVMIDF